MFDAECEQDQRAGEAHDAVGRQHLAVGPEPGVARQRAARGVHAVEADEAEREAGDQEPVAVELPVDVQRRGDEHEDHHRRGHDGARAGGAHHERTAADALGPPVRERPADLLLERQEQPGAGHEDEAPERAEGGILRIAEAALGHDDEDVGGHRGDHEARADCEGPLRDGAPRSFDDLR